MAVHGRRTYTIKLTRGKSRRAAGSTVIVLSGESYQTSPGLGAGFGVQIAVYNAGADALYITFPDGRRRRPF